MKKLLLSFIAVKRIISSVPATAFDRTDLEIAARTSLELGGFIQPLVVRRTGTELELTYEVVSGHFQYHAACIARDIDFLAGETVAAYIMEPETEAVILQQLAIIPGNTPPPELIATEEIETADPAEVKTMTTNSANIIDPQSLTEIKIGRTRFNIELKKEYKGASWWWTCRLVSNKTIYDRCVLSLTETECGKKQWVLMTKTNAGILKGRFAWSNNNWQVLAKK
jgi:hypothetical protein